jgi:hypothetical protein
MIFFKNLITLRDNFLYILKVKFITFLKKVKKLKFNIKLYIKNNNKLNFFIFNNNNIYIINNYNIIKSKNK